jgi:hypothetical protein
LDSASIAAHGGNGSPQTIWVGGRAVRPWPCGVGRHPGLCGKGLGSRPARHGRNRLIERTIKHGLKLRRARFRSLVFHVKLGETAKVSCGLHESLIGKRRTRCSDASVCGSVGAPEVGQDTGQPNPGTPPCPVAARLCSLVEISCGLNFGRWLRAPKMRLRTWCPRKTSAS